MIRRPRQGPPLNGLSLDGLSLDGPLAHGPILVSLLVGAIVAACLPSAGPASPAPRATPVAAVAASPPASVDGPASQGLDESSRSRPRTAAPSFVASPAASPTPSLPRPTQPFAVNLARSGDFVAQYTFEWCVGASIQMALNIVGPADDRTRARQQELWELAQRLSESPFGGANARGWTGALNEVGLGPYLLVSEPDFDSALRRAATALRDTQRPVGLLMWRGRHAWVMSGFTSLGDPASVPNFEVTGVRVLDPLYPHGDDVWGPSPKPNSIVPPATLAEQFVARGLGRVDYGVPPGYFLVLPVAEVPAA